MMVEGILAGSGGPILYKNEDMSKFPAAWNNKPLVVYHPGENGAKGSACTPTEISQRGVGVIMNTHIGVSVVDGASKPALKAEAWVEIDRAAIIDNRVVEALDNEETMELSTGLFVELERVEGLWNGEDYIGIAHNFQPDHLALLPDVKGACSIADGAGFIRNSETSLLVDTKDLSEAAKKNLNRVIENEMSFDTARRAISEKLWDTNDDLWVDEVFPSFFIYWNDGKLYKQDYLITDGVCNFVGEPVEVERVTEFRTKDGKFIGNRKDQSMKKSKMIDGLIANTNTKWTESDREVLEAMNETVLGKIIGNDEKLPEETAAPTAEAEAVGEATGTTIEAVENTAEMSETEYLEKHVPVKLRSTLMAAMNTHNKLKDDLIATLVANESCVFTEGFLKSKDLEELQNMVTLAGGTKVESPTTKRFDYSGQIGQDTVRNGEVLKESPLGLETL
jgi:hypothetical protein